MESARPVRASRAASSAAGASSAAATVGTPPGPSLDRALPKRTARSLGKTAAGPFGEEVPAPPRAKSGMGPPPPMKVGAGLARLCEAEQKHVARMPRYPLDLEAHPWLASKLPAAPQSKLGTPSKLPMSGASTYSSPLTDPPPLTKATGAAATAAMLESASRQPPPPPRFDKPLTRSSGKAAVEERAQLLREYEASAKAAASAEAQMRAVLAARLHGAAADIYETLKMEWVLQEECSGTERSMGMAFTAGLKAARLNFEDLPESRGWGVYELGALQRVLQSDLSLQAEVVAPSIAIFV